MIEWLTQVININLLDFIVWLSVSFAIGQVTVMAYVTWRIKYYFEKYSETGEKEVQP